MKIHVLKDTRTCNKDNTVYKSQREREYNFLKYWRIVRYWARKKYDLSVSELDMILFLYDEGAFDKATFEEFAKSMNWDKTRFSTMRNKGLIKQWRQGQKKWAYRRLYELTPKAKTILSLVYKKLAGDPISEHKRSNPIMGSDSFQDKVMAELIKKMNAKNRE